MIDMSLVKLMKCNGNLHMFMLNLINLNKILRNVRRSYPELNRLVITAKELKSCSVFYLDLRNSVSGPCNRPPFTPRKIAGAHF